MTGKSTAGLKNESRDDDSGAEERRIRLKDTGVLFEHLVRPGCFCTKFIIRDPLFESLF